MQQGVSRDAASHVRERIWCSISTVYYISLRLCRATVMPEERWWPLCSPISILCLTISDMVARSVEHWTCNQEFEGLTPVQALLCSSLGQVIHTCVPLSASGIIWYWHNIIRRSFLGSWFQRQGDWCLTERAVVDLREEEEGGQERVTTSEEWVLRWGWTEIRLYTCRYEGWVVVRTLYVCEANRGHGEKKWKCIDFKCVRKPTESQLTLTHHANKSSCWAQ